MTYRWTNQELRDGCKVFMESMRAEIQPDMQTMYVSQSRVETAQRVYLEKCSGMVNPLMTSLQVLIELGMYDCASMTPEGHLALDMTDAQWIGFGAAMAAVAEMDGILEDKDRKVAVIQWVQRT